MKEGERKRNRKASELKREKKGKTKESKREGGKIMIKKDISEVWLAQVCVSVSVHVCMCVKDGCTCKRGETDERH